MVHTAFPRIDITSTWARFNDEFVQPISRTHSQQLRANR
jgi:hypothetical protein